MPGMSDSPYAEYAYSIECLDSCITNDCPVVIPSPVVLVDGRRLPGIVGIGAVHVATELPPRPPRPVIVTLLVHPTALVYEPVVDADGQPLLIDEWVRKIRVAVDDQQFMTPIGCPPRPRPWHENEWGPLPVMELDVYCGHLRVRGMTADEHAVFFPAEPTAAAHTV